MFEGLRKPLCERGKSFVCMVRELTRQRTMNVLQRETLCNDIWLAIIQSSKTPTQFQSEKFSRIENHRHPFGIACTCLNSFTRLLSLYQATPDTTSHQARSRYGGVGSWWSRSWSPLPINSLTALDLHGFPYTKWTHFSCPRLHPYTLWVSYKRGTSTISVVLNQPLPMSWRCLGLLL